MGADAFHVFFGIRYVVQSEQELTSLEDGTDPRLAAAKKARLKTRFGRPTGGTPHFLFIGHHLGTFGVENAVEASLSEEEVHEIMVETKRTLQLAGLDAREARLYFQLEAQY